MTDTATRRIRCRLVYARVIDPDGLDPDTIARKARECFARAGVTLPEHPDLDVREADDDELAVMFLGRPHDGLGAHIVEYATPRTEQQ